MVGSNGWDELAVGYDTLDSFRTCQNSSTYLLHYFRM